MLCTVPGRITFETQGVRDASSLVASASKEALDSVRKIAIGQTLVPTHMARERFGDKSAYAAAAAEAAAAPGPQPQLDMRSSLNDAAAAIGEARSPSVTQGMHVVQSCPPGCVLSLQMHAQGERTLYSLK